MSYTICSILIHKWSCNEELLSGGRRLPATPPHPSALRLPQQTIRSLNQPASGETMRLMEMTQLTDDDEEGDVVVGSAEAINFPRLNSSPTRMMRTYTPEPRGLRGRRELPREPWRQTDPRARRDPLSFEQAVALGTHFL